MKQRWVAVIFMLIPGAASGCDGEQLRVDLAASTTGFTVTQGDAPFSGEFRRFGGKVCLDGNANISAVDVWLDPASVDTGLPEVDELLLGPEFFRTDEYPRVTFESESVRQEGVRLQVIGRLVINGIARQRDIAFRMTRLDDGRWRASGEFSIMRLEHELGRGEWDNTDYLDNEVEVAFNAILVPAGERKE